MTETHLTPNAQWPMAPNALEAMAAYVERNAGADTARLMLKSEPGLPFSKALAVTQIECRRRARGKIPGLLAHREFVFPKPISAEQCTHERVAQLHASLLNGAGSVIDMTMGLGVDAYYVAQRVGSVTAIELDPVIAAAGAMNMARLAPNVRVVNADCAEFIAGQAGAMHFDAAFIDPARRGECNRRLCGLADCLPNVLELMPRIAAVAPRLLIKASPMIDVTQSMRDLGPQLTDVWAVSVRGECKELLFDLNLAAETEPAAVTLHAINYAANGSEQAFDCPAGQALTAEMKMAAAVQPGTMLYEPNASVMKIGAFGAVATRYGVYQLARDSHLYVSHKSVAGFPGRGFVVDEVVPLCGHEIKRLAKAGGKLNVAVRNWRMSADELKKRLRVTDGGDRYAFATTLASGNPVLLMCHKPQQE